jgi:putative ABC transport system substrate-binding protein
MTTLRGRVVAATGTSRLRSLLAACILAAPLVADAQPAKVYRIGYLTAGPSSTNLYRGAFQQGLRELGWVEGQNIVTDYRFAEGRLDRLPDLAAELVRLKVDVIVASPTAAAVAAKNATRTIPIVMWGVGDPVGLGLVASLARPGGNVTGLSFSVGMDSFGKGLELLREAIPKVSRVAVLSNPANPAHARALDNVKAAARSLGVQLQFLQARGPSEFDAAFAAMVKDRAAAVLVMADSVFVFQRERLADLAARSRLPTMHGNRENVEAGGLMSYGGSNLDALRRAVTFVDKILKGTQSADLPVEQPTTFELVINLRTAKALGLTIPSSLLLRADQVIE